MAARIHGEIPAEVLEEAADWFVEFRVGRADVSARARFYRWLCRSPQHIRAYLELSRTYAGLAKMKGALPIGVDELLARVCAEAAAGVVPLRTNPDPPMQQASRRAWRRPAAAAAAIGLALGAIFAVVAWQHRGLYSTGIGEQRSITLPDGSVVDLDAHTRIRVRFTKTKREIELLYGQALFADVDSPVRPFIVRSHGILVQALGTQFDVNREVSDTVVTVIEGKVTVQDHAPVAQAGSGSIQAPAVAPLTRVPISPGRRVYTDMLRPILVSAGEELRLDNLAHVLRRVDVREAIAWRNRTLIFDGTSLADVVHEFNRYSDQPLVVTSPTLAAVRISGVYRSTNPASFLRFLRAQPGIVVRPSGGEILIEPAGGR